MKATKFLPLALFALMLTPSAFAISDTASQKLDVTVDPYIDIKVTATNASSAGTVTGDYSGLNITALDLTYDVTNNQHNKTVILSAKCDLGAGGTAEALGGSDTAPVLVFTNKTGNYKVAQTDVTGAFAGSDKSSNRNAIAFTFTPTITPSEAASAAPSASYAANKITYTLTNGKYAFKYLSGTSANTNTFSTHDENGTYSCTLTMTAGAVTP